MMVETLAPFLAGKGDKVRAEMETRSDAVPQFLYGTGSDSSKVIASNSLNTSEVGLPTRSRVMEWAAATQAKAANNKKAAVFIMPQATNSNAHRPSSSFAQLASANHPLESVTFAVDVHPHPIPPQLLACGAHSVAVCDSAPLRAQRLTDTEAYELVHLEPKQSKG